MDQIYKIGASMVQGDLGSIQQTGKAAIGRTLAENLDIKLGDKISATFPTAKATDLTVTGIFFTGTPLDEKVAFVSLKTARNFRDKGDVINAVEISLQDIALAEELAAQISSWGYNAKSWQENNPEIMRAINIGGFWTRFSVLLFMVVAFFGVASIMNLLVVEKTREIGMLMAMGASRSNIRDIFLAESAILGFMGAAAGTALGLAGVLLLGNVPFEIAAGGSEITTLPLIINPWEIFLLVFWAVALSIVAAVYPARKASRLDPVMALRGG
jgi:lipoprotein-releasing system permease protein